MRWTADFCVPVLSQIRLKQTRFNSATPIFHYPELKDLITMSDDSRSLAKELVAKVREIKFQSRSEPADLRKAPDQLIEKVVAESHRLMKSAPDRTKDQVLSEVKSVGAVTELRNKMLNQTTAMERAYEVACNERKQLAKIEHGQGLRRVLWRAASTASVAAVILFAWWFAHKNGIPLPLMRSAYPASIQ